ncbi:MAG: fibronectin type III domain-containing protein, partial [Acidobacteria bacterium]|nr:fibronectin type III domain-containing protein [Acidobacteriota bacterium]
MRFTKYLVVAALLLFPQFASAGDITLAWDPNTEPELLGYRLSYGAASGQYSTHVDVGNVTTHKVSSLPSGTYYFAVKAYSADMESAFSNEVSATVSSSADTQPPAISNAGISGITSNGATITWTTNEPADSQIEYGPHAAYGFSTTLNTSMVTSHSQGLRGLSANMTYYYRIKSRDAAGNLAISGAYTFRTLPLYDTTKPTISNVVSSSITATSAKITWTTNEAADTQVEYGTTTSYGKSTALNSTMLTAHSQSLSGLTARTTYHYRVKSKDAAGNLATSGDYSFTTLAPPDTTAPTISNVASSSITTTSATITWTTNEAADTQVEYGTTTSYGKSTTLNGTMLTAHSQSLSGLTPGTTYHYRVKSKDAAGNPATSIDYTFSTISVTGINAGLAAAYSFDEGIGTLSADASGNGNAASIYSATWTTGKYGNALFFNGTGSYVSAGTTGLPGVKQPKTVSFWFFQAENAVPIQTMLALANPSLSKSVHFDRNLFHIGALGYENTWIAVSGFTALNVWSHLGYVFDGSKNFLYINGVLAATSTIAPADAPVTSFEIGRLAGGTRNFKGKIDDVRIYTRALTRAELVEAMNTPVAAEAPMATQGHEMILASRSDDSDEIASDLPPGASGNPVVDLQLSRQVYRQRQTVTTRSLWISNPSMQNRDVELKIWIELPGLQPISLGSLSIEEKLTLEAGFNHNYGAMPLLEISDDAPAGICRIGAR